jgi:hypothetical protein
MTSFLELSRKAVRLVACAAVVGLAGCELDNADSVTRDVGVDFSGFYTGDGGPLVSRNSGNEVTTLNLRQTGDELEAIDNNGLVFRGTLGEVQDSSGSSAASFTMQGYTTAGNDVTISGTLTGSGTSGTMRGTWIEPAIYGTVAGKATINLSPTNSPSTNTNSTITIGAAFKSTGSLLAYRKAALWFMDEG